MADMRGSIRHSLWRAHFCIIVPAVLLRFAYHLARMK